MVSNLDLEKWQKAIQGIEKGQSDLSPGELSAFAALKDLYSSGNFESSESGGYSRVIKDNLSKHGKHRLLKVHLTNFVALCEQSFTNKVVQVAPPIVTSPIISPPAPENNTPSFNPPKGNNKNLIIILIIAVVLIGGWYSYKNSKTELPTKEENIEQEEPQEIAQPIEKSKTEPVPSVSQSNHGKVSVSGGSYTGELKEGKPHGQGTLTYNAQILIDERDMKQRYAEKGQHITGQFYNGRLVQGKLFDSDNNHLETIVLGRAN
ncbi:MAG: hypothetical protein LBO74_04590 [Candidatus Symbiothrix sp.]|jgi:hypothetical protein|nr:hypothetical protein [Candidatus Symbiothrix sp.]